jgi:hypothetical protein
MKILTLLLLLCLSNSLSAQSVTIEDVKARSMVSAAAIVENDVVKGYYYLFKTQKGDDGIANFRVVAMDAKCKILLDMPVVKPSNIRLWDVAFNENVFMLLFF